MHVFLDECLVEADDALEQVDRLLAIVDLSRSELVNRGVIGLELARLEERDRVFDQ